MTLPSSFKITVLLLPSSLIDGLEVLVSFRIVPLLVRVDDDPKYITDPTPPEVYISPPTLLVTVAPVALVILIAFWLDVL